MRKGRRLSKFDRSVADAIRRFESDEKRRETLIKDSRDVVAFCSKSIVNAHTGDIKGAKTNIENALEGLNKLRTAAGTDLDRYISAAEMEFVEASAFYSLLNGKEVPSIEELNVKPSAYILGLLDTIGEIKRKVFDYIRAGRQPEAEALFEHAETIYSSIRPLAVFDNLIPGIRRKLDVDRILLEDMRGLMTEEVRRNRLLDSLEKVGRKLGPFEGKKRYN